MFLTEHHGLLQLRVKIVPNSSRTQIVGPLGDALKIKIAQPPESGKANAALIELLSSVLQIPESSITLTAGHSQPHKTLRVRGISLQTAAALLSNF